MYVQVEPDLNPDGPLELPDMDEDLLEIFVQEGGDILDASDTMMARLREQPHEREIVSGLQRELHTLKGGARMAGLAPIGDLSHAMEALLELVADGRRAMDRVSLESLERGFDRLHQLVQRVAKRQAIGMPVNAVARFDALVAGEAIATVDGEVPTSDVAAVVVPVTAAAETAVTGSEAAKPAVAPAPTPRPARDMIEEVEEAGRVAQEMIRVRSDLLDNLVNYAGEVSIYRSRLEQQMGTFRFNLQELDQTVLRLREQLRKLEIETEAQIIARYQREHETSDADFDPLELDRFSTLQQLSRALAESVSDLAALQSALDDLTRQAETLLLQQSRVSSDLQEGLMRTRMVPFDSVVPRLRRLMRQTAGELSKRAQLRVEGAQGEMDRNVLDRMTAPLEHMLRNSMAHGIETPAERAAQGKNEEGTVTVAISREATEVVIRVSDDGKGMDRDAIRRKAIERGLLKPDAQLSDRDLFGFVLETGFSTAETVSKIAGRGVGMDVVHSEIKQLGGSLAIDSVRGKGSQFTVRLPFTLAVTQAILVRIGEHLFAVPMSSVQGVVRIRREDLDARMHSAQPVYSYGGDDYTIYEMNDLLGTVSHRASDDAQLPLLMVRSGDQRAAVRVDAVLGSREVVVKSVGPQISSVPGIFGATIMGDGSVVMILDMAPLVRKVAALRQTVLDEQGIEIPYVPEPVTVPIERRQPLIMVVDDSITMRKVTSRVLERNDMEVTTAKDGLDAVEKIQDRVPDLVLLDIEMPRMDGYEFATYMRNDPRLKAVPIIMITSRTGEKHRQRAMEIGVDRYLGKPYQEADLLRNVDEILRLTRAVH
ncbi:MAG: response regulator [Xanthomonadales bacterium]|nr:response regulator [Xanthomonadales bacterium]